MSPHREIDRHFAIFQNLVARADGYLKGGNYNAAAVYAEIAASYATDHHPGLFVSYQLEGILLEIGRKVASKAYPQMREARRHAAPRHVLHVLTEAAGIGGHTRMVWRWIQQDTESRHSVVLTRQGFVKIPQALKDAVKASQGNIYRLNDKLGNILTWSQALRRIAASADVVVLHIYTDDVIPLIAFADKRSMPPVIFLNHSDHKFWVGASISDIVADQRRSGSEHTQTRRGVDKSRCGLLPVVLTPMPRKISISEAKAQIGVSQETILLLSIARPSKYVPFSGNGASMNDLVLPNAVLPVLKQHPNSALIVIGPESNDRWERASQAVQGRITALGRREDTALFYQAADIYLDSYPFTSITSCLEAGSYALPLVSCHPFSDNSDILCADTPALDNVILRVKDSSEYTSVISRLIEDPDYRARIGVDTQKNILSVHTGENWKQYLHALYLRAANTSPTITIDSGEDQKSTSELDILSLEVDRSKVGEDTITQDHMRLFPIGLRMNLWLQMFKQHRAFLPSLLLPEWLAIRLIRAQISLRNKSA